MDDGRHWSGSEAIMFSLAVRSCSCLDGALLGFKSEGDMVPKMLGIARNDLTELQLDPA